MTDSSFRFRLERVRALRERREDAAKQELAGALPATSRARSEVEAAADGSRTPAPRSWTRRSTAVSATDLIARQAYLERTEHAHQATRQDLQRHERRARGAARGAD